MDTAWRYIDQKSNPLTRHPHTQRDRSVRAYRGFDLTVYLSVARPVDDGVPGTPTVHATWHVRGLREGQSPELPAAEWEITITGAKRSEAEAQQAAQDCADLLFGVIKIIEASQHPGSDRYAALKALLTPLMSEAVP